jgi:acyl-CoA thioesterase
MYADLAADTRARAGDRPGRYHINLPTHWDYLLPSGGVVMACAMRAAEQHIADPGLRLVSATTIFASPIHPGELVADVDVIRRGNTTAQVRVALQHARHTGNEGATQGDPLRGAPQGDFLRGAPQGDFLRGAPQGDPLRGAVELLATFARDRRGPDVTCAAVPAWAKSFADSTDIETDGNVNPNARFRFNQQYDCKIAAGGASGWPAIAEGVPRYATWMRYRVPQRDANGNFDRLALPPIIDIMPAALYRAIGSSAYRFYAPSLDLTMYSVNDTGREWLLIAVTLRRARAGLAIADAEVWDDEGRFVAYGAQAMYVRGVSGEAPTIELPHRR